MNNSSTFKPLGTLRGVRTKKPFKFFWNRENHQIYLERSGFFGPSKEKIGQAASSWEMAYHAAESYVFDR